MTLGTYGTGPWQITLNIAESNTTAFTFAAVPFSENDSAGFAVGWNQVGEANNSGAELWQYTDVSYQQFSTPQSNLSLIGDASADITNMGNAIGLTVIADALVGDGGASPYIDVNYTSPFVNTTSNSTTIDVGFGVYNNNNGAVVVACISSETFNNGHANVTSVTGGGYTWQLRKKYQDPRSNCGQSIEIWYTIVPPGSGTEDYINVTWDRQIDDANIVASSWGGVNQSQPFTTSGAVASNDNGGTPDVYDNLPTITITGGFSIVPMNAPGIGSYYLVDQYRPATNNGEITIPTHTGGNGLDFNSVNENSGNAIYINKYDSMGNDNSTYLNQLVGNHTHLTFTQGGYHITFDCTAQAWQNTGYSGNEVYHDPTFEGAPQNSMTIITTSGVAFNNIDPVSISIQII